MTTNLSSNQDRRLESRSGVKIFVNLVPYNHSYSETADGLTDDYSDNGLGLITYQAFPIGTDLGINICGHPVACGRVVNIQDDTQAGMYRVGLQLVKKNQYWPL